MGGWRGWFHGYIPGMSDVWEQMTVASLWPDFIEWMEENVVNASD